MEELVFFRLIALTIHILAMAQVALAIMEQNALRRLFRGLHARGSLQAGCEISGTALSG